MVRLFDNGLISTDRTLFPEFDGGLYYIEYSNNSKDNYKLTEEKHKANYYFNKSNLIVSRGLSRGHIGFRLFNQPELVYVDFN